MNKNVLIIIVVLSLIGAGFVYKYKTSPSPSNPARQELPSFTVPIKEYVLSGKVLSIQGSKLTVTVDRTFAGPEGNYIASETKVVTVGENTKLYLGKLVDKKYTRTPIMVSDIKVGSALSMYSNENIAQMNTFTPTRIDVSQ